MNQRTLEDEKIYYLLIYFETVQILSERLGSPLVLYKLDSCKGLILFVEEAHLPPPALSLITYAHTHTHVIRSQTCPFFTKLLLVKVFYHIGMKLGHVSCHSESPDQEPKSSLLHRVASVRYLLTKMNKVTTMVSFLKCIETPQVEMQELGANEL